MTEDRGPVEHRVLTVTADDEYAAAIANNLSAEPGLVLTVVDTVEEAVATLATDDIDCIVSDHDLPDTDGIVFLETVRAQRPTLPFVLFTSEGDEDFASRAISADVTDYLVKGTHGDQWDELAGLIRDAVAVQRRRETIYDQRLQARAVLDALPDMVLIVQDGTVAHTNRAATHRLDENRIRSGEPITGLFGSEGDITPEVVDAVARGHRYLERVESTLPDADGGRVAVEATAVHIQWQDEPAAMLVCREIPLAERRGSLALALRDEGRLVDRIFENSPVAKYIIAPDGAIVRANEKAETLLGLTESEIVGMSYEDPLWEFVDADGEPVPSASLPFDQVLESGEPEYGREYGVVTPDGDELWLSVNVSAVLDEDGEIEYIVVALADETVARELREELTRSERLHRLTLNSITDTVFITDDDGRFTYVCPNVSYIFGRSATSVSALGTVETLFGTDPCPDDFEDGVVENVELAVTDANGDRHDVLVTIRSVEVESGSRLYSVRDITDRKRQEERFRAFVENSSDMLSVLREDLTIGYITPSIERQFGHDPDALVGQQFVDIVHPDDREEIREALLELLDAVEGTSVTLEHRSLHADGSWRWTSSIAVTRSELANGPILVNSRDVTDRVERERQLEDLEETRSLALQVSDAGIWEWNIQSGTVQWHESCERLFGLDPGTFEGTYEAFLDRVHPDDVTALRTELRVALEETGTFNLRYRIIREDGVERWVDARGEVLRDADGEPDRLLGVVVDITEQQEHLKQLQVLDTVLRHKLRNDMTIIRGFAESIREDVHGELASNADAIIEKSDEFIDLAAKERKITNLLSGDARDEQVELTAIVRDTCETAAEQFPDAVVECELPAETVYVSARQELADALFELVENAVEHNTGTAPRVTLGLETGESTVSIVVSDNGPGLPQRERDIVTGRRDIDPLYHGDGLGLWLIASIVRRSAGTLDFAVDEHGTEVRIRLARTPENSG